MTLMRVPIDLTWSLATGSPGVNVWHVRTVAEMSDNLDLAVLVDVIHDFYEDLTGFFTNDFRARFAGEAQGVGPDEGTTYTAPSWEVAGSGGTDSIAPATAMLVNWKTNTGGRRGRGRTFISPLYGGAGESNGTPAENFRTELLAAANALIETSDTFANGAVGVYSRVDGLFRDFTSAEVPNKFAVLRSRRD